MNKRLVALAQTLWGDFDTLPEADRERLLTNLAGTLFCLPWAVAGLAWLVVATDLQLLLAEWPAFLLFLVLGIAFGRVSFFQISGAEADNRNYNVSSLQIVVSVAGVLVYGPTAVWIVLADGLFNYVIIWPRNRTREQGANWLRNLLFNLWVVTVGFLAALALYQGLGGQYPLSSLVWSASWPALLAVLVLLLLEVLFFWLMALFWRRVVLAHERRRSRKANEQIMTTLRFLLISGAPAVFGILAAVLFSALGVGAFLFLMAGTLLVSVLARRLSRAVLISDRRSNEMFELERLGRAIIAAPADASELPQVLARHVPRMLEYQHAEIRLFSGETLLRLPDDRPPLPRALWDWLQANPVPLQLEGGERMPWSGRPAAQKVVMTPILGSESGEPVGGICLVQEESQFANITTESQDTLKVLAAQIALALNSARVYQQTLEHQKTVQELAFAGQIQSSFLPDTLPQLKGWDLAAILEPAQETSGDFYDAISLPNGKLGLVVADVADKGMGAALYMALSRTLLRTYAYEYHDRPDFVLRVANRRILADTQADLFVSVFYAVVDPYASTVTYANAGHNPPLLLRRHGGEVRRLLPTGMVLGVADGETWDQECISFEVGDSLFLYSDGVTDAQNINGDFFGEERLRSVVQANHGRSAGRVLANVMDAVHEFAGTAPQFDDITMMVLTLQQEAR